MKKKTTVDNAASEAGRAMVAKRYAGESAEKRSAAARHAARARWAKRLTAETK